MAAPLAPPPAAWCARAGLDVLVIDSQQFPRDKACGDGLTPRAIAEMTRLGMADWLTDRPRNWGLRAAGFGQTWHLPWPGGSMPNYGSAAARVELDNAVLDVAKASGARFVGGLKVTQIKPDATGRIREVGARRWHRDPMPAGGGGRRRPLTRGSPARPHLAQGHRLWGRGPGVRGQRPRR